MLIRNLIHPGIMSVNFPSILAEFLTNVSLGEGRGGGGKDAINQGFI